MNILEGLGIRGFVGKTWMKRSAMKSSKILHFFCDHFHFIQPEDLQDPTVTFHLLIYIPIFLLNLNEKDER
jgi:hypothetical protein